MVSCLGVVGLGDGWVCAEAVAARAKATNVAVRTDTVFFTMTLL
jgi:hypothetical protein